MSRILWVLLCWPWVAVAQDSAPQALPAIEQARIRYALQALGQIQTQWPNLSGQSPCIVLFGPQGQWQLGCRTAAPQAQEVPGHTFID